MKDPITQDTLLNLIFSYRSSPIPDFLSINHGLGPDGDATAPIKFQTLKLHNTSAVDRLCKPTHQLPPECGPNKAEIFRCFELAVIIVPHPFFSSKTVKLIKPTSSHIFDSVDTKLSTQHLQTI